MLYLEIALPIPHFSTFTYKISKEKVKNLKVEDILGRRVLVPFRSYGLTGIVTDISQKEPDIEVKEIIDFPDKEPLFTADYIKLVKELSDYYISPIGMFFHYIIPEGLRWEYNPKTKKWIKKVQEEKFYIPNVLTLTQLPRLSPKSKALLEYILERGEVTKEEIKEEGFSETSLRTLIKKNLVKEISYIFKDEAKSYFLKQKRYIKPAYIPSGNYIYNTEVFRKRIFTYISLFYEAIEKGESSLIIFPNISSVEAVYRFLKNEFGDKVYLYHDKLKNKEKVKNWFLLKRLKGTITVGTFSALFIPIKNLKNIVIEEEYSDAYRNKRTPKFDARRVAYHLQKIRKLSVIYGSSVPSIETYFAYKKKIFRPLNRRNIFTEAKGKLQILPFENFNTVKKLILKELKEKKNTLIIANKKGFSSFLFCEVCETEILCNFCDVPVKVHKEDNKTYLKCSACGKKYQYIEKCPDCENPLKEVGFGIDKIAEILKENNIRFSFLEDNKDTDVKLTVSILGKEATSPVFEKIINIYPDFILSIPDYRSEEQFFRNITLPYFKTKGKYILITNETETKSIESLKKKNLSIFYEKELEERKELDLPPFTRYILLTFDKKDLSIEDVKQLFSKWLEDHKIKNISYEGPFFARISKMRNRNRIQILLKEFNEKKLLVDLYEKASKKGIKLNIEIDPREIK